MGTMPMLPTRIIRGCAGDMTRHRQVYPHSLPIAAFKRAKASDRSYVIVMKVDAYDGWTAEGHTWWEVGTPHVSEHEKVRAAHAEVESARGRQRKGV